MIKEDSDEVLKHLTQAMQNGDEAGNQIAKAITLMTTPACANHRDALVNIRADYDALLGRLERELVCIENEFK